MLESIVHNRHVDPIVGGQQSSAHGMTIRTHTDKSAVRLKKRMVLRLVMYHV
jgi:hypothetical protein